VSPRRYAQLGAEDSSFLIPVHEDFRVIALGVPAPPYPGKSLDPPLRSRFQIRRVDNPNSGELYENLLEHGNTQQHYARLLATISGSIESAGGYNVTPFPSNNLESMCHTMNHFPKEDHRSVLLRAYPLALEDDRFHALMGNTQQNESQKVFSRSLEQTDSLQKGSFSYPIDTVTKSGPNQATVSFLSTPSVDSPFGSEATSVTVPCGRGEPNQVSTRFVPTTGSKRVLTAMVQEHAAGRDVLLISPKGEGKNATAQQFAGLLGYDTHLFGMYSELTSRDLLVRRTTDSATGETSWEESPLITAARQGDICILDGIEKLRPDVLSSLQSLATDREVSLPDGRRLVRQENIASDEPDSKVIPAHPSFRIVALGSLTKDGGTRWMTADAMSMFSTLLLPSPTEECIRAILKSANPSCPPEVVDILLKFSKHLTYEVAEDCGVAPMSTRNMIRVARRVGGDANLHTIVCSVLVADLLPPAQRASLESLMEEAGITRTKPSKRKQQAKTISIQDNTVTIGDFSMKRGAVKRPEMVPFPKFFDIPSHVNAIQDLLQDWSNGERALLLLGNQGVGKNMIVDRICQIGT
jgi:MoxR-like ATPase